MDSIGGIAFFDCASLTTVNIDGNVGSIGDCAFENCDSLTSVTINGSVDSIRDSAFRECHKLSELTITGPITSIDNSAFFLCDHLRTLNIACGPLDITGGSSDNGGIALYADTVNKTHAYSADYDWSADGKSCTVHIVCANTSKHNHDIENVPAESIAKTSATCTTKGTTTYSISGTYDGFDYSDAKDVQDIPALGYAYSATYDWTDDGSSCIVHVKCANNSEHDHDVTDATVTSTVKIPPTETEMGTTEYSVSGTYDGFAYFDTKDLQDIPSVVPEKKDDTMIYVCIAVAAVIAIAGGAFLFIRLRR